MMMRKKPSTRPSIHVQVRSGRSSIPSTPHQDHRFRSSRSKSRRIRRRKSSVRPNHSHNNQQTLSSTALPVLNTTVFSNQNENNKTGSSLVESGKRQSASSQLFKEQVALNTQPSKSPPLHTSSHQDRMLGRRHRVDGRNHEKKRCRRNRFFFFIPMCLILLGAVITALCLAVFFQPKSRSSSSMTLSTAVTATIVSNSSTFSSTISASTSQTTSLTSITATATTTGYLSFVMTWSRSGDGDIVVTTPNNRVIAYQNRGPSSSTDQGQLDQDDQIGTGPENVVWLNSTGSSAPPTGTYHVCFEPYSFSSSISTMNPITVTLKVLRSTTIVMVLQRTFTAPFSDSYSCSSGSNTLIGSYSYP